VGQDVPFEYICEGYCQKKKRISFFFSHLGSILKLKLQLAWGVGYCDNFEGEPCVL
jgi:hypothetical protein